VYFGNNEDYLLDGTYLWLIPSQNYSTPDGSKRVNGGMYLGFDHNDPPEAVDGKMQGGMNEYGLCFDTNGLPVVQMKNNTDGVWPYTWVWLQILWECRNTTDVIHWFETHCLGDAIGGQSHFCDADGNSLVVGVNATGNLVFTTRGSSHFLVSTNFNLANPLNGWYPCPRYDTATAMLESITTEENLTVEACRDILKAVTTDQTSYSNIFDPISRSMHLYCYGDFETSIEVNLDTELEKITAASPGVTMEEDGLFYKQVSLATLHDVSVGSATMTLMLLILTGTLGASILILAVLRRKKE
jgi:hypothetical protein